MNTDGAAGAFEEFAAVLTATKPAFAASGPAPLPTAADQTDDAPIPTAQFSDQVIALLSGTWTLPAAASGVTGAADAGTAAAAEPASLSTAITPAEATATQKWDMHAVAESRTSAAAFPASLSAAITPANAAATQKRGVDAVAEPRTSAAASPTSLSAAIMPASATATQKRGVDAVAGPRTSAAASPASLSAAIMPANATTTQPLPETANAEGGAGAVALPASSPAAINLAAGPPVATTMGVPSPGGEPHATPAVLATLAASRTAAAARDTLKPGDHGDTPADALSGDIMNLTPTAPTAPLRAALPTLLPPTPLVMPADPDAGFDDSFGTRITWLAEQRLGHAQIRLNPEHVGPIEVRVQLDGDRLSAQFSSVHAEVRQAIEASLPRLREMLGQHGLQLGQADVGQGGTGHGGYPRTGHGGDRPHGPQESLSPSSATIRDIRRLLDEYA